MAFKLLKIMIWEVGEEDVRPETGERPQDRLRKLPKA